MNSLFNYVAEMTQKNNYFNKLENIKKRIEIYNTSKKLIDEYNNITKIDSENLYKLKSQKLISKIENFFRAYTIEDLGFQFDILEKIAEQLEDSIFDSNNDIAKNLRRIRKNI